MLRVEERLISEYGVTDHRSSVIPLEGSIHRRLLSFERLIETGRLPEIRQFTEGIDGEFTVTTEAGHLENSKVVMGSADLLHFKNGGVQYLPWAPRDYQSNIGQDFFLTVRRIYRDQLRTMCLLRR